MCGGSGISRLSNLACEECNAFGFRPADPTRTLRCNICGGSGISRLSSQKCERCDGYGTVAPPSFVRGGDDNVVRRGLKIPWPKGLGQRGDVVLATVEIALFVAAAVFGILWIRASGSSYEALAAFFALVSGGGVGQLRRYLGHRQ